MSFGSMSSKFSSQAKKAVAAAKKAAKKVASAVDQAVAGPLPVDTSTSVIQPMIELQDPMFIPISPKAPAKISNTQTQIWLPEDTSLRTLTHTTAEASSPQTNLEMAISKSRIEPLTIVNIKATDFRGVTYSPLSAAISQAYLEDRISQKFTATIFEKILATDEKAFEQVESRIGQQIGSVQNTIDQLYSALDLLKVTNTALDSNTACDSIASIASQKAAEVGDPEPLLVGNLLPTDPRTLIDKFSCELSKSNLDSKSRTALATQALQVAAQTFSRGYTPAIMGDAIVNVPAGQMSVAENLFAGGHASSKKSYPSDLSVISQRSTPDKNYAPYIQGLGTPYVEHDFYKELTDPPHRRSLALVTMLANEFALSAGLGRLAGTPLGNRFGSNSTDYVSTFVGTTGVTDASMETKFAGSLADNFVVAIDGSSRAPDKKRVVLLDGSTVQETPTVQNTFDTFLKSVVRDPSENNVKAFNTALSAADIALDEGLQFYKKLHLRDKTPKLLTPRGLYTRLFEELQSMMAPLTTGTSVTNSADVFELAIVRDIAIKSRNVTQIKAPACAIKAYFVGLMAHVVARTLSGKVGAFTPDDKAAEKKGDTTSITTTVTGPDKVAKTYTIDTTQNEVQTTASKDVKFSKDILRISPVDVLAVNKPISQVNFLVGALAVDKLNTTLLREVDGAASAKNNWVGFMNDILRETSLLNRLIRVFLDMHDEAKQLAKSESGDATWLDTARMTRNSHIDGTLLLTMLLEAMLDLIVMFVDADFGKNKLKKKFLQAVVPIGPKSQNALSYKALSLLIQGSKSNDFSSLASVDGLLPDLDNNEKSKPITVKSYQSQLSFQAFEDMFSDLARERDLPMAALTSVAGMVSHTFQQTRKVVDLAAMLRNEKDPTDMALALRTFAQGSIGKQFLAATSDYSMDIAQNRLDAFKQSLTLSSKRNAKLTAGEVACMLVLFEEISSIPTDNLIFCAFGMPGDFVSSAILPSFKLSTGYKQNLNEIVVSVQVQQDPAFSDVSYEAISREFSVLRLVDENSFGNFLNKPPTSVDDIVERVTLLTGITGKEFIKQYADPARARRIVTNEVQSFLLKKAFSTLATADMLEKNLVNLNYASRSAGSLNLARNVAQAMGLPENTFDLAFFDDEGVTQFDEVALLDSSVPKIEKTTHGQITTPQAVDLGTAELVYDIFNSTYFYDGLIDEHVFSPAYFDKTIGALFSSDEFKSPSNKSEEKVKGSKAINTANNAGTVTNSADGAQGTVSMMSYSSKAVAAAPMVTKK